MGELIVPDDSIGNKQTSLVVLLSIIFSPIYILILFSIIKLIVTLFDSKPPEWIAMVALIASFVAGIYTAKKVAHKLKDSKMFKLASLTPSELMGPSVVKIFGGLLIAVILGAAINGSKSTGGTSIYTCEIHDIKSCNGGWLTGGAQDCLFTNKSNVSVNPSQFSAWHYDSKNVLLEKGFIYNASPVPSGQTIHMKMNIPTATNKTIICSMNPTGGFVDKTMLRPVL